MIKIKLPLISLVQKYIVPTRLCWAECVTWANYKAFFDLKLNASDCRKESEEYVGSCMCGAFRDGKHVSEFTKAEIQYFEDLKREAYEKHKDDTPF